MTRRLVSLPEVIEDAQDAGEDINALFIDPSDLCSIDDLKLESEV
ncbi:hypothetical protein ACFLTP_02605 [Chloroflexota bacterium]